METINVKLSERQKEIIKLMRLGWKAEQTNANGNPAFLFKNGFTKRVIITVVEKLIEKDLLSETHTNIGVTHFHLTELGKTINID